MRRLPVARSGLARVKGTQHTAGPVLVDEQGPRDDRTLCLVDTDRRQVLRTVRHPGLLALSAEPLGDDLRLSGPEGTVCAPVVPSGERVTCDYWGRPAELELAEGPHAELASTWLRRSVRLALAPRGAVVYNAPVTLITTGSLRAIAELAGLAEVDAARFRATAMIEVCEPYAERTWIGSEVEVGQTRLRVTAPIPRCAVINLHPQTGEADSPLLRVLAENGPTNAVGEPFFGVFAEVVRPGALVAK